MFNGQKIKKIIEEKGLTYKDVYESIGMTGTTFFNITSGEGNPKADNLEKLADILQCPIDAFFDRDIDIHFQESNGTAIKTENSGYVTIPKDLLNLIKSQSETIILLNKKVEFLEKYNSHPKQGDSKFIVSE